MPSRKIISILILTVALVAGIMLASGSKTAANNRGQVVALKTPEVKLSAQATDDWKSGLSVLPAASTVSTSSDQTLTDKVSQSLISNYLSMKQQGTLNSDSAKTLIDQAGRLVDESPQTKYTSANIIISNDNSTTAIKTYGSALGSAIKLNAPSKPKNEVNIFLEMLKNKNVDLSQDLMAIAKTYRNIAQSLLKVTVPSSLASSHLKALNSLEGLAESIEIMSQTVQDPLRALQGVNLYSASQSDYTGSLSEIMSNLNQKGIIYKQGEGGYYLFFRI